MVFDFVKTSSDDVAPYKRDYEEDKSELDISAVAYIDPKKRKHKQLHQETRN